MRYSGRRQHCQGARSNLGLVSAAFHLHILVFLILVITSREETSDHYVPQTVVELGEVPSNIRHNEIVAFRELFDAGLPPQYPGTVVLQKLDIILSGSVIVLICTFNNPYLHFNILPSPHQHILPLFTRRFAGDRFEARIEVACEARYPFGMSSHAGGR